MEDIELQKIWADYNIQMQQAKLLNMQAWAIALQSRETLQLHKAQNRLNRLARFKTRAIVLGIAWILVLCGLIFFRITWQGIFFNLSLSAIALITAVAVVVYIRQVILIRKVDETGSIAETQQMLAKLQASTIRIAGILWLQAPFYATWFITPAMITQGGTMFWLIEGSAVGLLTYGAVWLYRNIHYRNMHKKWFRVLFNSPEWTNVIKAMSFLQEIEEWKKNELAQ